MHPAGTLSQHQPYFHPTREDVGKQVPHLFKTPLWRSALNLDTDDMLRPVLFSESVFTVLETRHWLRMIGPEPTFAQYGESVARGS